MLIRDALPEDAPALLEIYAPYVLNTAMAMKYLGMRMPELLSEEKPINIHARYQSM